MSVCAYAARANPVGAGSVAGERLPGWLGGSWREAAGARGCGEAGTGFLPQRIPSGGLCLLEAAGLRGHCVGRLKGFGGTWGAERPATWPGSGRAQSAQRGRGRRRAQGRICGSGRDQAWPPPPRKCRRPGLLSPPGTWWGPSPSPLLPWIWESKPPVLSFPPETWCPKAQGVSSPVPV